MNKNIAKKFAAVFAAAAILLTAGCGDSNASENSSDISAVNTEDASVDSDVDTAEAEVSLPSVTTLLDGVDGDTIVASTNVGGEAMNITMADFLREYKFYLSRIGIADDSAGDYSAERENIIGYIIMERVLAAKFEELALEFTDDDISTMDSGFEQYLQQMKSWLSTQYSADIPADELYELYLEECGLTEDYIYGWQRGMVIENRLSEYINDGFTADYSEAEEQVAMVVEYSQYIYENDPSSFDGDTSAVFWLPDGSRYVQQILLKLDDEDITELLSLRSEGSDEEADALLAEKLKALDDTLAEVQSRIAEGEDFSALMSEYSADGDTTASYLVTPGTGRYVESFTECAMAIQEVGEVAVAASDYGYHIIKYTSDAVVTEEMLEETTQNFYQYLTETYKQQNYSNQVSEWVEEYDYKTDREVLMLAELDDTAEAETETG